MPEEQNKLYLMIGRIEAGVDDLRESHKETQHDIKELRDDMKNLEVQSNGIKPVLSGAGLGGLLGGIGGYLTKFMS